MPIKVSPIPFSSPPLQRKRNSASRDVREKIKNLKVNEAVELSFDAPKKSIGSFMQSVVAPLAPRRYHYRTMNDEQTKFTVWRSK